MFVVEDEPDTREFLERFLTSYGAAVEAVGTAAEALAVLPRCEADILVSDIGLPDMDGYDLMEKMRRMEPNNCGAFLPSPSPRTHEPKIAHARFAPDTRHTSRSRSSRPNSLRPSPVSRD